MRRSPVPRRHRQAAAHNGSSRRDQAHRAALRAELAARASPPIGHAPGRHIARVIRLAERLARRAGFRGEGVVLTPYGLLTIKAAHGQIQAEIDGYAIFWRT